MADHEARDQRGTRKAASSAPYWIGRFTRRGHLQGTAAFLASGLLGALRAGPVRAQGGPVEIAQDLGDGTAQNWWVNLDGRRIPSGCRYSIATGECVGPGATQEIPAPGQAAGAPLVTGKVQFYNEFKQEGMADALARLTKAFEAKYPGATLESIPTEGVGKLVSMIASDTAPDVFISPETNILNMAVKPLARPLDNWIARDKFDVKDFNDQIIAAMSYRGQLWALTWVYETQIMYYNRNRFQQAAIPEPDSNWTYEQWLDAARRLTQPGSDPPVWGGHHGSFFPTLYDTVWAHGGDVFSEDSKRCLLGNEPALVALQWVADLYNRHKVAPPPSYTSQQGQGWTQLFITGRVSLGLEAGAWVAGDFLKQQGLDWRAVAVPKGPQGRANFLHLAVYGLAVNAKNPEGGWAWLKFFTSPEGWRVSGTNDQRPPLKSLEGWFRDVSAPWLTERGVHDAFRVSAATLRAPAKVVDFGPVQGEISKALAPVWAGEKSARMAMAEAIPGINGVLAKAAESAGL